MKNTIHHTLVHFPIALTTVGTIFALGGLFFKNNRRGDLLRLFACWTMTLGAVSSIIAMGTGFVFTDDMTGVMGMLLDTHIIFAMAFVLTSVLAALLLAAVVQGSRGVMKYLALAASIFAIIMMIMVVHYGEMMAFGA